MNKIGVFDSGVGGLTVLDELVNKMPNEYYFYYGDTKNCPYGEKSKKELRKIVGDVVDFLVKKQQVKIVVIACNTATTECIKFLRKKFPKIDFVGTEPAIKVALDGGYRKILVLATPGTVKSGRVKKVIIKNKSFHQKVRLKACPGLADAIEHGSKQEIKAVLDEIFKKVKGRDFDAVVLGCTHYIYVRNEIQKYVPGAVMIDGNEAIAKRVQVLLAKKGLMNNSGVGSVEKYFS